MSASGVCGHCGLADVAVEVVMPAGLSYTGVDRPAVKLVDACIAEQIIALNAQGRLTANSCCGHGKRPGEIIMHDGSSIAATPSRGTAP